MGLKLGGFKAKLFRGNKKNGEANVVCLSYKIHADTLPTITGYQSQEFNFSPPVSNVSRQNGKNEVVRMRKTTTKPEAKDIFNGSSAKIDSNKQPESVVLSSNATDADKNVKFVDAPSTTLQPSNNLKSVTDTDIKNTEDNRVSPLIHMTSDHNHDYVSNTKKQPPENEYAAVSELHEVHNPKSRSSHISVDEDEHSDLYDELHETDTISVGSTDMYDSQAASIFFGGSEPAPRPRVRKTLRNYEDNASQTSQTSA